MNDDGPLSDLEKRLRSWHPAEVPAELRARLRSASPLRRRETRPLLPMLLTAACALAVGVALLLTGRFAPAHRSGNPSTTTTSSATQRADTPATATESHWVLGESLTMNICTGLPPGTVPAALRLDGDFVGSSGLIPVRSTDGILPLKVDCQF